MLCWHFIYKKVEFGDSEDTGEIPLGDLKKVSIKANESVSDVKAALFRLTETSLWARRAFP